MTPARRAAGRLGRARPGTVALLGSAVGMAVVPSLVTNYYHLRLLSLTAIAVILVASLNLIYGYTGQVSLGQAGFNALGAYGTALLMTRQGLDFWLAWPAAIGVTAAVAWAVGRPVLRLRHFYFAVATFGFGVVVHTVANRWLDLTGGPMGVIGVPRPRLPGLDLTTESGFFYLAAASMLVTLSGVSALVRSPFGRTLMAIREGEEPVDALGVNTGRAKTVAFVLSAALAAAAGGLFATLTQYVGPGSFTESHSIRLLAVLVIGGLGRTAGAVIGGVLLVFLTELARLAGDYQHLLYSAALVAAVLYLPGGIAGVGARLARRARRGRRGGEREAAGAGEVAAGPGEPAPAPAPPLPPAGGRPLLQVEGLTCRYGEFVALDGFDMEVGPGELVALIGPNGAGKSTFINAVSGAVPPAAGTVLLDGVRIDGLPPHRIGALGVGRTFQATRLFSHMTVEENLMVGAHAGGGRDAPGRPRSPAELLDLVGLAPLAQRPAASLPFGQRRLLELARALAARPRVLLLDEPAAGLNEVETNRLGALLGRLRSEGLTLVLVEHDLNLVMSVSDRVVVLAFGHKIGEGPPEHVRHDERVVAAYLGDRSRRRRPEPSPLAHQPTANR